LDQTRTILGGKLIENAPVVGPGLLQAIAGQKSGQDYAGQNKTPIKRQTVAPGQSTAANKSKSASTNATRLADALRKYSSITTGLKNGALAQAAGDDPGLPLCLVRPILCLRPTMRRY